MIELKKNLSKFENSFFYFIKFNKENGRWEGEWFLSAGAPPKTCTPSVQDLSLPKVRLVSQCIDMLGFDGEKLHSHLSVPIKAHQSVPNHHYKRCHMSHQKGVSLKDVREILK